MRRAVYLIIAVALVAALAGFFREKGESFTGLILSVAENRVLVVAGIDDAEMEYEKLLETGNRAIWFSVDKKTEIRDADGRKTVFGSLQKGQKVEVRFSGPVLESYPEQTGADRSRQDLYSLTGIKKGLCLTLQSKAIFIPPLKKDTGSEARSPGTAGVFDIR